MNACVSRGIKYFIYASSTEAIGLSPGDSAADERTPCRPSNDYGRSKAMAELDIKEIATKNRMQYLIIRSTGVYGPGDTFVFYELMQMINSGLLCFVPGNGLSRLHFTPISDVVDAFIAGLRIMVTTNTARNSSSSIASVIPKEITPPNLSSSSADRSETVIVCADEAPTFSEWLEMISLVLGRSKPRIHIPLNLVGLAVSIIAPLANFGKRKIFMYQRETVQCMGESRFYSNKLAKQVLNWNPRVSHRRCLEETAQYYFDRKLLRRYYFSPLSMICFLFLLLLTVSLVLW